jgi:hypothetical protein
MGASAFGSMPRWNPTIGVHPCSVWSSSLKAATWKP